jgi:hypothetical protein
MEKRFNYYIKNWTQKMTVSIPESCKTFKRNELYFYKGLNDNFGYDTNNYELKSCYKHSFWWTKKYDQGDCDVIDIPCLTISADGIDNQQLPALVKVRYINDEKGGIVCPVEYNRHWDYKKNLYSDDIKWHQKLTTCVWRGTPTGIHQDSSSLPHEWKNLRMKFCYKYREKYDVGITCNWDKWDATYIKPNLTIKEMLKYKYQISIPGNDKDSGLNWKLASNSLVLMAKPTIESWLMEGLLQPYVHYIPLKDDYSDLDDIINWCRNNDNKCQEIVRNANTFMKQFENIEIENKLFQIIKEYYKKMFIFI